MIALLLAACLSMPLFDMSGPPCADETVACRCSECIAWDATHNATRYEVERETVSSGTKYAVGTVAQRVVDEAGTVELPELWCAAWDNPFPREDVLYRYRVRACNDAGCSDWSAAVQYRAAAYACFDGGVEVQCYVGDEVASR